MYNFFFNVDLFQFKPYIGYRREGGPFWCPRAAQKFQTPTLSLSSSETGVILK
jgi:hypothetical protein